MAASAEGERRYNAREKAFFGGGYRRGISAMACAERARRGALQYYQKCPGDESSGARRRRGQLRRGLTVEGQASIVTGACARVSAREEGGVGRHKSRLSWLPVGERRKK